MKHEGPENNAQDSRPPLIQEGVFTFDDPEDAAYLARILAAEEDVLNMFRDVEYSVIRSMGAPDISRLAFDPSSLRLQEVKPVTEDELELVW